jgi:hypothetical protein
MLNTSTIETRHWDRANPAHNRFGFRQLMWPLHCLLGFQGWLSQENSAPKFPVRSAVSYILATCILILSHEIGIRIIRPNIRSRLPHLLCRWQFNTAYLGVPSAGTRVNSTIRNPRSLYLCRQRSTLYSVLLRVIWRTNRKLISRWSTS